MEKLLGLIKGFGLSILFILIGVYILKTNDTLFGNIIGFSCIIFFGIVMLWTIYKMTKSSRVEE